MCNRTIVALLIVLACCDASAQTDSAASNATWFMSFHTGVLFPDPGKPLFASLSLVQGVRCDRLSVGIGVGYDGYDEWKTVPLFVSAGWDIFKHHENAGYLKIHGGYARAWHTPTAEVARNITDEGGYFVQPMLGYRLSEGKLTLHFSAGYKFQRLHYEETPAWGWLGTAIRRSFVRDMERVSVQIGIGLH